MAATPSTLPCVADGTDRGPDRIQISVSLDRMPDDGRVEYIAACPPNHGSSFSGSGLPYADARQAFQGTPNRGTARVQDVRDSDEAVVLIDILLPNAYYTGLGTKYVPPTVYLTYTHEGRRVEEAVEVSAAGVPYRTLTHPEGSDGTRARRGAEFYDAGADVLVRSQEAILRQSAYPSKNEVPPNFWGTRPPL